MMSLRKLALALTMTFLVLVTLFLPYAKAVQANPYSTVYEFDVPIDGQNQVTYHHEVQVYIQSEWNNQYFTFKASRVDDWVLNVKMDGTLKYRGSTSNPPCQPVSVDLGPLSAGYHTLEFDFVERSLGGRVKFYVQSNLGRAALTKFHIKVPDYGNSEVRYTVTTHTYFSINDYYFLKGYANDFIDDLYVNGLKWRDWEWGDIYAWGDGFIYPLGQCKGWYDVQFDFGEKVGSGRLDFEYLSWTNQRDEIGPPRFRAVGNLYKANYVTINSAMFYGGSKWKFEDDPQFSERYFEARQVINANYYHAGTWFDADLEVGLGLGWAEWALLPATMDDVGITINSTWIQFESNRPEGWVAGDLCVWVLALEDYTLDIYSFPALEIKGIEFSDEGESIVNQDLTVAMDYTGTVIMSISGALQQPIGAITGLAIKGLAAIIELSQGQEVCRCQETISEDSHRQLCFTSVLVHSDVVFFKLNPAAGNHCGITKVVLKGTLIATYWVLVGGIPPRDIQEFPYPIGNVEITLCIPWFLRG